MSRIDEDLACRLAGSRPGDRPITRRVGDTCQEATARARRVHGVVVNPSDTVGMMWVILSPMPPLPVLVACRHVDNGLLSSALCPPA
jgi:hypothetical protein